MRNARINELLEQRDVLTEIAFMLYGEFYVAEKAFWESPTQRDLYRIESELYDLGWEESDISPEMEMAALLMFEALKNGGIIPDAHKEEEEDEEI
jgi:hypothetical protein